MIANMNDVNTRLYPCAKTVESKLGVMLKKNLAKVKIQSGKLISKWKLKQ